MSQHPSSSASPSPSTTPPSRFALLRDEYVLAFLERNPVTSTYLGGEGLSATLLPLAGRLRDYRQPAIDRENAFYRGVLARLGDVPEAELSADERVDRDVICAQIRFMLRLTEARRHHLRAVDTYASEPARGLDWSLQGMSTRPDGGQGSRAEWDALLARVRAVPGYLAVAQENLARGVAEGTPADRRMIERDGIEVAGAHADYFRALLPDLAARGLGAAPFAAELLAALRPAGAAAAEAYHAFGAFLAELPRRDGFVVGEAEYDFALRNNLRVDRTARELFPYGAAQVRATQSQLIAVAEQIARARGLALPFGTDDEQLASVRAVLTALADDAPRTDAEALAICRERADALVAYARRTRMFELPASYRLDILETPPQLASSIDAAYYPAPPFKGTGVGRFYLSATGDDPGLLKYNNRHALADLCAHEGFPGHDWHYQYMAAHRDAISPVRWLTPGAVEDTSSMWEDSMASEGWALYAEELMAEPRPGAPGGFYTLEERLYQLNATLLRDVRVHVDTGIHLGLLTFDEAVDYFARNFDFVPDARARAATDETARAALNIADRAIYRYSKWPTQAVTYHLGKQGILDLRQACARIAGPAFSVRRFNELFMEQGTIPAGYIRDRLLAQAAEMVERE